MKNLILNLEGVKVLSRKEQKKVNGGLPIGGSGTVCKAACNDGSLVTVDSCSNAGLGCSSSGGSKSCKCDYPGPFDPPPGL